MTPLSGSDRDHADQLAAFIVDHIGNEYTAEECGRELEIRPQPTKVDALVSAHLRAPVASVGVIATGAVGSERLVEIGQAGGELTLKVGVLAVSVVPVAPPDSLAEGSCRSDQLS